MRELKFRAWDKGNKAYIYPTEKNGGNVINAWIDSESDVSIIEQFTGLKDKNGAEIYEGDVVEGVYDGVIKFDNECASFGLTQDNITMYWFDSDFSKNEIEVIGNVHEVKK